MRQKTSFLKYLQLAWLSGPECERDIYRQMVRRKPQNILEIGLGMGIRTLRIFQIAGRYCQPADVRYTGIDLFEGRPAEFTGLPIKDAYTLLRSQGVNVRLVPGEPPAALQFTAQAITNSDLIVIDADIPDSALAPAWNWMHRLMHGETLLMRIKRSDSGLTCNPLMIGDVAQLAAGQKKAITRAA